MLTVKKLIVFLLVLMIFVPSYSIQAQDAGDTPGQDTDITEDCFSEKEWMPGEKILCSQFADPGKTLLENTPDESATDENATNENTTDERKPLQIPSVEREDVVRYSANTFGKECSIILLPPPETNDKIGIPAPKIDDGICIGGENKKEGSERRVIPPDETNDNQRSIIPPDIPDGQWRIVPPDNSGGQRWIVPPDMSDRQWRIIPPGESEDGQWRIIPPGETDDSQR